MAHQGTKNKSIAKIFASMGLILLAFGISPGAGSRSSADEWDEAFNTARAVLAKMPDPARLDAAIKDEALRKAVRRAYDSLKACAKVHPAQNRATKVGTLAEFERSFKAVQTLAENSDYKDCAKKCSTDGEACAKDCASARKRLCGCKLTEFGCFAIKCVIGQ